MSTDRQNDLLDLIDNAEKGWDWYRKDLVKMQDIFFGIMDDKVKEYLDENEKSSLFFPKAQSKMRRLSDSLINNYFSSDKFVSLDTITDDKEEKTKAIACEKATKDELENTKFFDSIKDGLYKVPYIGTVITRTYWTNSGLAIEDVNIEDFFFDIDAVTQNDVRYVVHNVYVALEDIKRMQREGAYKRDIRIEDLVTEDDAKGYTRVKLQEIYTKVGEDWKVSTVYDDQYFLRQDVKLKDGLPFNWGGVLSQLKRVGEDNYVANYFEPPIANIVTLQEEYNIRRNQIIDGNKQQINPRMILPKQGIDVNDINKPTGHVRANNPVAIQVIPPAQLQVAFSDLQAIDNEMSEVSAISAIMNGVSETKNKTATQSGIEHSEGNLKLQIYTKTLNETYFEPLMRRIVSLVWKYSDHVAFKGVDRSNKPMIKAIFNVGLGVKNDIIRGQELNEQIGMMNNLLQIAMQLGDQNEVSRLYQGMKELMREKFSIGGFKNADEFLGKKNELV